MKYVNTRIPNETFPDWNLYEYLSMIMIVARSKTTVTANTPITSPMQIWEVSDEEEEEPLDEKSELGDSWTSSWSVFLEGFGV